MHKIAHFSLQNIYGSLCVKHNRHLFFIIYTSYRPVMSCVLPIFGFCMQHAIVGTVASNVIISIQYFYMPHLCCCSLILIFILLNLFLLA
jgi:hypothetical protein